MLTMEAYLDNSATTRCSEAAKNKMVEALTVDFGNPSSMHMKGVEAEKYVKEAATAIAKTLRCQEKEIVFTSGGTESNNLAIIGTGKPACRQTYYYYQRRTCVRQKHDAFSGGRGV